MIGVPFLVVLCAINSVHGHYLLRWIGDGGKCVNVRGDTLYCVHPHNCYPQYTESETQTEICGVVGGVTIMCCANDFSLGWSGEDGSHEDYGYGSYPKYPYPSPKPTQIKPTREPPNKGNPQKPQNNNETEDGIGEQEQDTNNQTTEPSNNGTLQNPQNNNESEDRTGEQGQDANRTDTPAPEGEQSASDIAKNVTINLPFYPPTPENSTSLRRCRNYTIQADLEAPIFVAVVGGRPALPGEFKHMALLGYGNESNTAWICGGSLISDQFVLTAAHCRSAGKLPVAFVRLGELDLNNSTGVTFGVESVISHPLYRRPLQYHDIALIKLNRTVTFSNFIRPACLATRWDLSNVVLNVSGWGFTSYLGESSPVLKTAALQHVSNERCRRIYESSRVLPASVIETLQVCADGSSNKRDSCQGDSGGPLEFKNNFYDFGRFTEIAGLTSFGINCALTAGVYTRVLPYVPWIESIVWPNE